MPVARTVEKKQRPSISALYGKIFPGLEHQCVPSGLQGITGAGQKCTVRSGGAFAYRQVTSRGGRDPFDQSQPLTRWHCWYKRPYPHGSEPAGSFEAGLSCCHPHVQVTYTYYIHTYTHLQLYTLFFQLSVSVVLSLLSPPRDFKKHFRLVGTDVKYFSYNIS